MQPSQVCSTSGSVDTIEVGIVSLTFRPRLVVICAGAGGLDQPR